MKKIIIKLVGLSIAVLLLTNQIGNINTYAENNKNKRIKSLCEKMIDGIFLNLEEASSINNTWDFSKAKYRRKILEKIDLDYYGISSKDLFGVATSKVEPRYSDWGIDSPYFKYKSIKKKGSNYIVKCNAMIFTNGSLVGEKDYRKKIGEVTFTIKKSSKSQFGYVVKKVKLKK